MRLNFGRRSSAAVVDWHLWRRNFQLQGGSFGHSTQYSTDQGLISIRVLVVDDHPLMRAGIISGIKLHRDMRRDGNEAILAFRASRPGCNLDGYQNAEPWRIESIIEIRRDLPTAVVLTTAAGDIQALQAGAVGYLLKNLLRAELIDTIRLVHAGGAFHPRSPSKLRNIQRTILSRRGNLTYFE